MAESMSNIVSRPRLGISSCLLGKPVRFDGGHKRNNYLTGTLSEYFDFVSFCPEQAIGLPTPRKPIRLINNAGGADVRAVEVRDYSLEYTQQLDDYARSVTPEMSGFSGYIVKKDSPSCGMERVKVYGKENSPPDKRGVGIFTARLMAQRPDLPIEEEGRLTDPRLRENFVTRVFTMFRWQALLSEGLTRAGLIEFHTRHKFLLLAHDETAYRELGRLLSDLSVKAVAADLDSFAAEYLRLLMVGLRRLARPGKHANVLMHVMGYVKNHLTSDEKAEMLEHIEAHRKNLVPVIVPITLLNHFLRKYPNDYIAGQYYLEPHPRELMLRNGI